MLRCAIDRAVQGHEVDLGRAWSTLCANAIVNTAQGVTKSLAEGGFWGIAQAAAGAAQISTILSTSEGSTSFGGMGTLGSGASGGAASAPAATQSSGPAIHVSIAPGLYSSKDAENLIGQLTDHLNLGGNGAFAEAVDYNR